MKPDMCVQAKPKKRHFNGAVSIREDLQQMKVVLAKVKSEQIRISKELTATHAAIESGISRISDILEGGSSQIQI